MQQLRQTYLLPTTRTVNPLFRQEKAVGSYPEGTSREGADTSGWPASITSTWAFPELVRHLDLLHLVLATTHMHPHPSAACTHTRACPSVGYSCASLMQMRCDDYCDNPLWSWTKTCKSQYCVLCDRCPKGKRSLCLYACPRTHLNTCLCTWACTCLHACL